MSPKLIAKLCFFTSITILCFYSCRTDKLDEPSLNTNCTPDAVTYDLQVKEIIDTYCSVSGCHAPGGDGPGDYTNYANMSPWLTATSFERSVVDLRDDPINGMPPDWTSNPAPQDLTEEDFDLIVCWIADGYPEN